jgi:hypothetical protein
VKELSLGQQFSQSKFIAEELSLPAAKARALYADHFDVEDGKVVPYDKPRGAANRTPLVDAQGNHIDFEAALRKIVDADPDKDSLLKSKVRQGAASGSTRPVHLPGSKNEPTEITGLAKIAAGLKTLGVTR